MLTRGHYRSMTTGDIVWLLYELDGYVHVHNRKTGKAEKHERTMFGLFFLFHGASAEVG